MLRKATWSFLGVAVFAALAPSQNYAQRNVAIRAGVVLVDSQQQVPTVQANYSPYVWFNADSNKNVKPPGWSFYNPNAATRVTPAINNRWTLINNALGFPGVAYPGGDESLTKRDAAYWEVLLSQTSDAQITSYDILHLSAYGYVSLNPLEQQKLRKFMEAGGVLWVDVRNGSNIEPVNNLPMAFMPTNISLGLPAPTADFIHPLLSNPHTIGFESLNLMQSEAILRLRDVDLANLGFSDLQFIQHITEAESRRFLTVASDTIGPVLMVGQVGDGFMVVTGRGVGVTLNRTPSGPNQASRATPPLFDRTADAAAKLVMNMASLTSGHAQTAKGSRKTNSSPIDVTAPLLKRFDEDLNIVSSNFDYIPPVVFQGLAVVTEGNQIVVYDANPKVDLDGNGNPDDGIPDFGRGANVDRLWVGTIPVAEAAISAPACAEVSNAPAGLRQQIAVTGASGNLYIFDAFPAGGLPTYGPVATIASPNTPSAADLSLPGRGPYPPTYHDGQIFVTDEASAVGTPVGRVWMVDAASATALTGWQAGGSQSLTLGRPSASAVIGYIPIADNSGGVDRVVYVPTRPNPGTSTAGISSFWLGARGEKPTSAVPVGTQLVVTTRAAGQGLRVYRATTPGDPLGVRLTIIDAVGNPLSAAALDARMAATYTENNGILTFDFEAGQTLLANESVRIDYTIDWGTPDPNQRNLLLRGNINLPDVPLGTKRILHNLALSPQGTLHFVHGNQGDSTAPGSSRWGGSFFSLREEGRGAFKLLNRFELYPQHQFNLNQATQATVLETLSDNDGLQQVAAAAMGGFNVLGGRFSQTSFLTFQGGPSIHNGVVYVTARGVKTAAGFPVECTVLLAFQAEPDLPKIYVGDLTGSFTILQPDIARSTNKALPDQFSTLQPTMYTYERDPGADRGTIRMDNLMSTTRGMMQNAISRSQPIIIRRSGQPDQLIEPDRTGSRWSPMLWYAVFHGIANQSPPTVTGKTVFFAGHSFLPQIIAGVFPPTQSTGMLTGLDADISPSDAFLVNDTARPWLRQLWQMKAAPTIQSNPDIRWPQTKGITDFQGWAIRVMQTTLGTKTQALGVVAGDGVLLSWAPNNGAVSPGGLYGFSRADFVVADEGRLGRFDSAGNPIWGTDAGLQTGTLDVGSAAEVKPLIRPTRAYPVGSNDLLIADPGADRVVRLDTAGREIRSIDRMRLDTSGTGATYAPEGFQTNDPLTLKAPRDVLTFTTYETNPGGFTNFSPTGLELWVHYVIADSGNRRIVELVDRYRANAVTRRNEGAMTDGSGARALGVLYWHSPASFTGKNFTYSSLARVFVDDPLNPRWVYAAGIGSALPTKVDTGLDTPGGVKPRETEGGNGGIVIFDGANSQLINEVEVPAIGPNILYNPATGNFDDPGRQARTAAANNAKKLSNLSSVSMRNVLIGGNSFVSVMFTDAEGVFEIVRTGAGGEWQVRWMLPREVYRVMRHGPLGVGNNGANISLLNPDDFRPYYARRLDSGEVLVVNGYFGRYRKVNPALPDVPFNGEVLQVDGDFGTTTGFSFTQPNLGFWTFSIRFELPPITGARGLVIPVFADRR